MFDSFNTKRDLWQKHRENGRKRYVLRCTVLIGNLLLFAISQICRVLPGMHLLSRLQLIPVVFVLLGSSYGLGYLCSRALWQKGIDELNEAV